MRVIGSITREQCQITFFYWNNRYLIKLESGPFEQTFKIEEYDLAGESDLEKIVNESFIHQAMQRFDDMASSLGEAIQKIE